MRLIDADALAKELMHEGLGYQYNRVINAPTVDAVPVIRCKDCALWDDADSEHLVGYCTEGDGEKITFRNEWCCWAERKEE